MKTRFLRSLICLAALTAGALRCAAGFPFVVETPTEFSVLADFDGDNIPDVIVVDKATGQYRIGYAAGSGHNWTASVSSGCAPVTGFSVEQVSGRFRALFVSPTENRVFTTDPADAALPGNPIFTSGVGPSQVVGINAGGAADDPFVDDLFITTELNGGYPGVLGELVRVDSSSLTGSPLNSLGLSGIESAVKRVQIVNVPPIAVVAGLELSTSRLRLFNTAAGAVTNFANATPLNGGTNYTAGFFGGGNLAAFLFYRPGLFDFLVWHVTPSAGGDYAFAPGPGFNLGVSLEQLAVIDAAPPQLLVIINGGTSARVYDFDGTNFPAFKQTLTPPAGDKFTLAAAGTAGRFSLNSGSGGRSERLTPYLKIGADWVAQTTENIPPVSTGDNTANVFLFEQEPFVDPQARLVARLNAADWSTLASLTSGTANAQSQAFGGPTEGLTGNQTRSLGKVPAQAHFALVNQYRPQISLHSRQPARGVDVVNVTVAPSSGRFHQGVQPSFTATPGSAIIHWRTAPSGFWQTFTPGTPPTIFKDSTLQYYAEDSGIKSAVGSVQYQFDVPPGQLDSDGDGVPDFVEVTKGLDPLHSGRDSDGDGYSDLEEILGGTNPNDAASHPAAHPSLDPTYDLRVSAASFSLVSSQLEAASAGTPVTVHDLAGALRGETNVSAFVENTTNFLAAPFNRLTRVTDDRLLALTTAASYALTNEPPGSAHGRELLALHTPPVLSSFHVDFTYNESNGQAAEADRWITAAQTAIAASVQKAYENIDFRNTLAALLVELKLENVLHSRGWSATNRLTLFPFRPADAGMQSLALAELAALELPTTNGLPGYSLAQLNTIALADSSHLKPQAGDKFFLTALAFTFYQASAQNTNLTPAPADALRQYLRTFTIAPSYLNADTNFALLLSFPATSNAVAEILGDLPARTLVTRTLFVTANSFANKECVLLYPQLGQPYSLVLADGAPFIFPQSFVLPAGSALQVTGYADLGAGACGGTRLEVVTAMLTTLPVPSSTDLNGNLLPDDWEYTFLGGLVDPFGDADGDGFSNLQEFLDGTDPNSAASHGTIAMALPLPVVSLQTAGGGNALTMSWEFPAEYAGKFDFTFKSTTDLGGSFTPLPVAISQPSPGHFSVTLPPGSASAQFYQLTMQLH